MEAHNDIGALHARVTAIETRLDRDWATLTGKLNTIETDQKMTLAIVQQIQIGKSHDAGVVSGGGMLARWFMMVAAFVFSVVAFIKSVTPH